MIIETKCVIRDKFLLTLGCVITISQTGFMFKYIFILLLAVAGSLFITYYNNYIVKHFILVLIILLTIFFSKAVLFYPVLLYDLVEKKGKYLTIIYFFVGILAIFICYPDNVNLKFDYLFLLVLAVYFKIKMEKELDISNKFVKLDISSKKQQFLLQKQNDHLIKEQNLNLALGISEERNRIARDIHDNVGHLLSSSLIQLGALSVLNHDSHLDQPLNVLTMTVQEGMNKIRESVHNIHDDSVNLQKALEDIVENFQNCSIEMTYRISSELNTSLKLDILMLIREALANVMKHSNATRTILELNEQPTFYRIRIKDNGQDQKSEDSIEFGMGLSSMKERVSKQGGRLTAEMLKDGFQIMAIVPKRNK